MSLINPSLEVIYCSNLASNRGLIRFIRFVSWFTGKLCNAFFILSRFKSPCKCRNFFFRILNFATKGCSTCVLAWMLKNNSAHLWEVQCSGTMHEQLGTFCWKLQSLKKGMRILTFFFCIYIYTPLLLPLCVLLGNLLVNKIVAGSDAAARHQSILITVW